MSFSISNIAIVTIIHRLPYELFRWTENKILLYELFRWTENKILSNELFRWTENKILPYELFRWMIVTIAILEIEKDMSDNLNSYQSRKITLYRILGILFSVQRNSS
jgi:hypothetical protein